MNQPRLDFSFSKSNDIALRDDELIGQLLIRAGKISDADIDLVVSHQLEHPQRFGEVAITLGLVNEVDIADALAQQLSASHIKSQRDSRYSETLFVWYEPEGLQAEALRGVRSALVSNWFTPERKSLAVVSGYADSRCSEITANLAILLAQTNQRTLLVDANLRAPVQHSLFDVENRVGLSDILAGQATWDVLQNLHGLDDLFLLQAGTMVSNSYELLGRSELSSLFMKYKEEFSFVLVDTGPLLTNSDAAAVVSAVHGALMVATKNRTTFSEAERVKTLIANCGGLLAGIVLNDA